MGGVDEASTASDATQPRDQQPKTGAPQAFHQTLADVSTPTMRLLWQRIASCMDDDSLIDASATCKAFAEMFRAAIKCLDVSQELQQKDLERLAEVFPNVEELSIRLEYDDRLPMLDFSGVRLPKLRELSLECCPMATLNFTTANTPLLEAISIENQGPYALHAFHLALPELRSLHLDYVEVHDPRGFGPSLSACPKLETFQCYKLWGLGGMVHDLNMPVCETLEVYRSDDLTGLRLYAPMLSELSLRACYGLECVRLLDEPLRPGAGGAAAAAAAAAGGAAADGQAAEGQVDQEVGEGEPQKGGLVPLYVNLVNANIDPESKRHLKHHPRVRAGAFITKAEDDNGFGVGGFGGGPFVGQGPEGDDESTDEGDDMADQMAIVEQLMNMFPGLGGQQLQQIMGGLFAGDDDEYEDESEEASEQETDEDA